MAVRLRNLWRNIHLWIGVGLTVLFIPLGLTGSYLVFDDAFERMLHPHRYEASAGDTELAPSRYFAAAQAAFGGRAQVAQLRMPQDEGAPAIVTGASGMTAWIDPASGKVLDAGNPRTELRAVAHQLHENLFMGRSGRRIVGVLGAAMFISSLTGLYLWWPRNNAVLKGLRWRRSPIVWSNLHHLVGFWSSLFLAILSLTGVALAFPELLRGQGAGPPRAERLKGGPGGPRGPGGPGGRFSFAPPVAAPRMTADQAVTAAEQATGGSDYASVRLPTQGGDGAWQVMVLGDNGPAFVAVDDATGQAKAMQGRRGGFRGGFGPGFRPRGEGGRGPAMRMVRVLHAGNDASIVWRLLMFVVGLVPTILGVTGVVFWLKTRRRPFEEAV